MGWTSVGVVVIVLFLVFLGVYFSLVSSVSAGNPEAMPDPSILLMFYVCFFGLVAVLACMRTTLLKRHGRADGDSCGSCLQACFCMPCVAAQMMRWTDGRFEKHMAVSRVDNLEMPVGVAKNKEVV